MATMTVTVERTDRLTEFSEIWLNEALPRFGEVTARLVSDTIIKSPEDRGLFKTSLGKEVTSSATPLQVRGEVFSTEFHGRVIEGVDADQNERQFGRSPGAKPPPTAVIRDWLIRRGGLNIRQAVPLSRARTARLRAQGFSTARSRRRAVPSIEAQLKRAAFLIARSIGRRGLPHPDWRPLYFRPMGRAQDQNIAEFERMLTEGLADAVLSRI